MRSFFTFRSRLPHPGITARLFLALLALCALTVLCMGLAARLSFQSGFQEYLAEIEQERVDALVEELSEEYRQAASWDAYQEPKNWRKLLNRFTRQPRDQGVREPKKDGKKKKRGGIPPPVEESVEDRVRRNWESAHLRSSLGLLSADRTAVIAGNAPSRNAVWAPILVDEAPVGWLTREPLSGITDSIDIRFQEQQRVAILIIALFGLGLAALFSLLLARTLIAPLRRFADTVSRLSGGDFSARVSPAPPLPDKNGSPLDELQTLAAQLNHLAGVLEANEQARRTFMAEVAHDLRTPLAVLRGEIEALEDGLRPATPETLASLRAEVELIGRLVEDIRTLSLADLGMLSFDREPLDASACFLSALAGVEERILARGLTLEVRMPEAPALVLADPDRLTQIFRNVLENSLRYTSAGGVIQARCHTEKGRVILDVLDSPPAVPEDQLPLLFDRFHTGDAARNRSRSGSGLGLAICRMLLEAQEGDVRALPSPLGGLWIRMSLPLAGHQPEA